VVKKITLLVILFLFVSLLSATKLSKKRILYVNSYHEGYLWSDEVQKTILSILKSKIQNIEIKTAYMDTKRNTKEDFKMNAALDIKKMIQEFKPELVITSDDNAAKYLIVPYYYNKKLPFIFTGINASAKKYNFPSKNVTGVIEVNHIKEAIIYANKITSINKVGTLTAKSLSDSSDVNRIKKHVKKQVISSFVSSKKEWKKEYLKLQDKVDLLIVGNVEPIYDLSTSSKEIKDFVRKNTKIPSVSWNTSMRNIVLMVLAKSPKEQGVLGANMVLSVLRGKDIKTIKIDENKNARIYINLSLAKKLGAIFPFDVMDNATFTK